MIACKFDVLRNLAVVSQAVDWPRPLLPRRHTVPSPLSSHLCVERKFPVPIFEVTRFQCAIGNSESGQQVLGLQVSRSDPASTKPLLLCTTVMLPHMDDPSESPSMVHHRIHSLAVERSTRQGRGTAYLLRHPARTADHCNLGKITIDMLPEEILLEVFAVYMCGVDEICEWETLVHVCRRWRSIVFAAPRRLNLQLLCTCKTHVRKMFEIWPALPVVVYLGKGDEINNNVLATLEKRDCIYEVLVDSVGGELEKLVGAMQVTFPALIDLFLSSSDHTMPLPESFLGGSAPNLRSLYLENTVFPALPKLLLSSPGLASLSLLDIPPSWPISSDALVDCLSSLTRLETLKISFQTFQLRPNRESRRLPPLTRPVSPVLRIFSFEGETEFSEQVLAYIAAPLLDSVYIRFFDPLIFDSFIPRIAPRIGCTGIFEASDQAHMFFYDSCFYIVLSSRKRTTDGKTLALSLQWEDSGWKLLRLTHDPHFGPLNLFVFEGRSLLPNWVKDMANTPWLHLVRFFPATEYMYLSQRLAVRVAPALQELAEAGLTEVLPVLRTIVVDRLDSSGPVQEALGQFVAARQLPSGHSVDVQCWVE